MIPSPTDATRRLGAHGPHVFPIALGCMGMSGMYGASDDAESIATIHQALERGVNLVDTGDFYGTGLNEMLIGRALQGRRDQALLSVKFGALRAPDGGWIGYDARPVAVKNFLAHSLHRLGVDHIDIYRPARLDPAVPVEETMGAIADMIKAGYVRHAALSEVGVDTIRRANVVTPIVDLQIEYSLISRGPETAIFPALEQMGVAATVCGVLSRGLLSGSTPKAQGDFRAHMPRFAGDNLTQNRGLVATLAALAKEKGVTATQLAIAWVLGRGPNIIPVLGARTRAQLQETLAALEVALSADELTRIAEAIPPSAVAGTRYAEAQMKTLDTER